MDSYLIPSSQQRFELEIKRSRFITSVGWVEGKLQAKEFIQTIRSKFPDANHHCWAMVAGQPNDVYEQDQSDDGEPKGTAGKPMLNVLLHSDLGNTAVVVSRYFGGIKLGAGGLVRAYTQSVSEALKVLETRQFFITEKVTVELPYSLLDTLEHCLQSSNIVIQEKLFSDTVTVVLQVPGSDTALLVATLDKLGIRA